MDSLRWQHRYKDTKNFLFKYLNKEFLVFLFFLTVSSTFWLLSTLNETYEKEISVPLAITDLPESIVITEGLPDSVKITLKDKGFNLLKFSLDGNIAPIRLPFSRYAISKNKGTVTPAEIQKLIQPRLNESTIILSIKAEHWDFYFCHGTKKRVPIQINGSISAKQNYYISNCVIVPDSITVLAEPETLDTIQTVFTDAINLTDLSESLTQHITLQHIKGAKLETEKAELRIAIDQLTEVLVKVPVKTVNVPEGVSLKTFPAHVDLRVAVGVRHTNLIKPELFNVIADYKELPSNPTEKLHLRVVTQPKGVVKTYIIQPTVDYLLESNE